MGINRQKHTVKLDPELKLPEAFHALSSDFNKVLFLNDNDYSQVKHKKYSTLLALGTIAECTITENTKLEDIDKLSDFVHSNDDWIFGHLNYDLKNAFEELKSQNGDSLYFPEYCFFVPEVVIEYDQSEIIFNIHPDSQQSADKLFEKLKNPIAGNEKPLKINKRIEKSEYLNAISKIKEHIQRGDIYEMNFCQEFYAENAVIDPYQTYLKLNKKSPAPYSAFYKLDKKYLISASPERYFCKRDDKVFSQPIKGTIKRGKTETEDEQLINTLKNSPKDISENIMIVDLVRNDLSRIAAKGSVKAEELCGIYSYPQVHQMISTISCTLQNGTKFGDILKASFPMGSMTGAPKIRAMQIIEQYESAKRGMFSGSVGYIDPQKNMDFNVIIRSIIYNSNNHYLSFITGGAITISSIAEDEYQESMLKASAMLEIFKSDKLS